MPESNFRKFNHLKIHSQFSICEGAIKIDELKDKAKDLKINSIGLCDTSNLCGAVEFSDKLSKVGTQPIIGTQINFKFQGTTGFLPLYALNIEGYKKIIELSSRSYLEISDTSDPHLNIDDLLKLQTNGISIFEGISDLANKESNRIKEMQNILRQIGIKSIATKDKFKIFGKKDLNFRNRKIYVPNLGDHRICMSSFILSILTGVRANIKNFETVFSSSPSFLKIMRKLGASFEIQN